MLAPGDEEGSKMSDAALLTTEDAARWLRAEPRTLERWRHSGKGPKFLRLTPRCVRYRLTDLEAWATAHQVGAPAAARKAGQRHDTYVKVPPRRPESLCGGIL